MVFKLQNTNAVNITGDIQEEVSKPFIIPCFAEPTLVFYLYGCSLDQVSDAILRLIDS